MCRKGAEVLASGKAVILWCSPIVLFYDESRSPWVSPLPQLPSRLLCMLSPSPFFDTSVLPALRVAVYSLASVVLMGESSYPNSMADIAESQSAPTASCFLCMRACAFRVRSFPAESMLQRPAISSRMCAHHNSGYIWC
ncbi:unnamed protein product [Sphacelaria rigidula]